MTENFRKIPEPEQERILKIILKEFAGNGYLRTSTNAIVQIAGIPKGTLFYYFGSKKMMFLYTVDEAVRRYTEIYRQLAGTPPDDLFEGLLYRMKVKLQFIQQDPLLYRFFYKAFLDIPEELKDEMATRFEAYSAESQDLAKENIDQSKLKEGIDLDVVLKMIHLMLEGLLNRYTPQLNQMHPEEGLHLVDAIETECRQYFDLIMQGIYKQVK